jgi:hypothetical protein
MTDRLITIAQFNDSTEAEMAKQLLANNGIEAVVTGRNVANIYSGLPALGHVELQTLESRARQAQELLESQKEHEQ